MINREFLAPALVIIALLAFLNFQTGLIDLANITAAVWLGRKAGEV